MRYACVMEFRNRSSFSIVCALAALLLGLVAAGCNQDAPAALPPSGLVTLAPHLTETVFALGKGDEVRAIGNFDDWPPEALTRPRAGGYLDPDLEKITLLRPALLIVPGQHPKVSEFARLQGIRVLNVHMDSLATIDAGIEAIGAALSVPEVASQLVARLAGQREAVRAAVADLPRPRVLIITQRQSHDLNTLYTAGSSSFVSEIVALAGGDNLYADAPQPYLEASKETIVLRAPEVILEFHCGEKLDDAAQAAYRTDWQALSGLPAVAQGRIHLVLESHGLRPGPRVMEIARLIALALHPGIEIPLGAIDPR